MSFSVRCERSGLEYASRSWNALFAQRRNVARRRFYRMLRDVVRFNAEAKALLADECVDTTLGDYVAAHGYSREFVDYYLVPMGAAIWSAPPERFEEFPATAFARFFHNHGLLDRRSRIRWRTVVGGSRSYVDALVAGFGGRVMVGSSVRAITRSTRGVRIDLASGASQRYDRVILACHSDQALRLLSDASPLEQEILGAISYQANDTVLHTDASLMPRSERAWASWNYHVPATSGDRVAVTYHMNRLQGFNSSEPLFVSLNCTPRIAPERILRRFTYHHPVFTPAAMRAQRRHAEIDGRGGVHYCGAYWGYGFHEDGVASALTVCRGLGAEL
jgi:predicted NAD/FAD-binding protein